MSRRRLAALLGCVVLSGCAAAPGSPLDRHCTLIGTEGSGVRLRFAGQPPEGARFSVCIAGDCRQGTVWRRQVGVPEAFIRHPLVTSSEPVRVEVYGASATGRPLQAMTATPERLEPNGPGCPPVDHQVQIPVPAGGEGG